MHMANIRMELSIGHLPYLWLHIQTSWVMLQVNVEQPVLVADLFKNSPTVMKPLVLTLHLNEGDNLNPVLVTVENAQITYI